jgi:hypothetical protein
MEILLTGCVFVHRGFAVKRSVQMMGRNTYDELRVMQFD